MGERGWGGGDPGVALQGRAGIASGGRLVCQWLLGVHVVVASWGERLTRISAETADVKRVVVVVVVVGDLSLLYIHHILILSMLKVLSRTQGGPSSILITVMVVKDSRIS